MPAPTCLFAAAPQAGRTPAATAGAAGACPPRRQAACRHGRAPAGRCLHLASYRLPPRGNAARPNASRHG